MTKSLFTSPSFEDLIDLYGEPKILAVDDAPKTLQMVGKSLRPHKFQILFANNGQQALEKAELARPDLILLDIVLPDLSGIEVCQKLKQNPKTKDIPIIFLSAQDDIETILNGLSSGANDYLKKPFHPKELIARIKSHLQKKYFSDGLISALKSIQDILHNISQSIFCINNEGIVIPPISNFSKNIFNQDIEGKNIFDFLFQEKIEDLTDCIGKDKIHWESHKNKLVDKLLYHEEGKDEKHLKIKYNPIYDKKDLISSIMFVIVDETKLHKLSTEKSQYTLQQASNMTKIPVLTLKNWMNRYKVPKTEKDEKGKITINANEIEKIGLLFTLVNKGGRIGKLSKLSIPELKEMADKINVKVEEAIIPKESDSEVPIETIVNDLINKIKQDNISLFSYQLSKLSSFLGLRDISVKLIPQLLEKIQKGLDTKEIPHETRPLLYALMESFLNDCQGQFKFENNSSSNDISSLFFHLDEDNVSSLTRKASLNLSYQYGLKNIDFTGKQFESSLLKTINVFRPKIIIGFFNGTQEEIKKSQYKDLFFNINHSLKNKNELYLFNTSIEKNLNLPFIEGYQTIDSLNNLDQIFSSLMGK